MRIRARLSLRIRAASLLTLAAFVAWPAGAAQQAPTPVVSMGHLHYRVRDVEANKAFWTTLGAQALTWNGTTVMKFPGVLIFLTPGESNGGTEGSVVNHVAFRVPSLAAIDAKGLAVQRTPQFVGIGSVTSPEGERIELFDETATNVGFTLDGGGEDEHAQRHNRPLAGPIAFHHIHLYVPTGADVAAKDWYAKTFGARAGKRWRYEAVDLLGVNMNFSGSDKPGVPLQGRRLEHIAFEVRGLEAFCARLAAQGVKLDLPYTKQPSGIATAMLTDPWGTKIELTEGLNEL